jgi:hypothetical protein
LLTEKTFVNKIDTNGKGLQGWKASQFSILNSQYSEDNNNTDRPMLFMATRDDEVSEGDVSDASFEMINPDHLYYEPPPNEVDEQIEQNQEEEQIKEDEEGVEEEINTDHLYYESPPNEVEDQVEENQEEERIEEESLEEQDDNDENDKEIEGLEGEEEEEALLEHTNTTESTTPEKMYASSVVSMTTSPYASSTAKTSRSGYKTLWDERFQELLQFKEKYGHTVVPRIYSGGLGSWVSLLDLFFRIVFLIAGQN